MKKRQHLLEFQSTLLKKIVDRKLNNDVDYIDHMAALIFFYTGVDADTLNDEQFVKACVRVDYAMKKTGLMK